MFDFKKEIKNAFIGLGLVLVLWLVIIFGHFNLLQIIILSCVVSLGVNLWRKNYSVPKIVTNWLIVIAVVLFFNFLGRFGWKGYVASLGTSALLILWWKWKPYLEAKRHIESLIWGKPLKDFIAQGERPPKIKITH